MKIGNLEVYGVIYKITNKVNGKCYIGQTTVGFKKRYDNSDWWLKTHNDHLKSSVVKYGIDNFYVCHVYDIAFSKEELDIKEITYINIYNSNDRRYGYNKKEGGARGLHSEESKLKMSKAHKGAKLSESTKLKMSEVRKGKNKGESNPMYGKNPLEYLSKEDYEKLMIIRSNNMKGENNPLYGAYGELNPFYGKKHSEETKRILSEKAKTRLANNNPLKGRSNPASQGGKNGNSKNMIKMVNVITEEEITFDSIINCVKYLISINIVKTIGTGKWAINESVKNNKEYKGFVFYKIRKQ